MILYGTLGCHLCEEAEAILIEALGLTTVQNQVQKVDIAEDEQLSETYGIRIPVLRDIDTGTELHWPFDVSTIRSLYT